MPNELKSGFNELKSGMGGAAVTGNEVKLGFLRWQGGRGSNGGGEAGGAGDLM